MHRAAVAQLDRVLGYEPRGRGFDSCQPHQPTRKARSQDLAFFVWRCHRFLWKFLKCRAAALPETYPDNGGGGNAGFRKWIARLVQLDRPQRAQLLALLSPAVGLGRVCATIHGACPAPACPACGGARRHRRGHDRGVRRYRCRGCGRTYGALTGTPLARLREHLLPVLDRDVLLVTDARPAYRQFAREAGLSHDSVNLRAGERTSRRRARCTSRTRMPVTGAFANGWRVSMASPRVTRRIISAGGGRSIANVSRRPKACCARRWAPSCGAEPTVNGDSAFRYSPSCPPFPSPLSHQRAAPCTMPASRTDPAAPHAAFSASHRCGPPPLRLHGCAPRPLLPQLQLALP